MAAKRGPKSMTNEHKAALEQGRAEGRAVRAYLEALRNSKPKRGRKRTPDSIQQRLSKIDDMLPEASAIEELQLVQERRDLEAELDQLNDTVDMSGVEDEFVRVAKGYAERKGISYASWRDVGVPAATLKRAGITRGR